MQGGRFEPVETQSLSSDISTILMEVTRSHTPHKPEPENYNTELANSKPKDEELLLIHRQIEGLQSQKLPAKSKVPAPIKKEIVHDMQTLMVVISKPEQTRDLKALKRQL